MAELLWYDKYRPRSLGEYVFKNDDFKARVQKWIAERNPPHLILAGPTGTGKTSLIKVLIGELGIEPEDLLRLNSSIENNVDTVRNKILTFCESGGWNPLRIVWLEESDNFSLEAQKMLRGVIGDYSESVRFFFTCNYIHRLLEPIRGRCIVEMIEAPTYDEALLKLITIFQSEGGDLDKVAPEEFGTLLSEHYPDLRSAINHLENRFSNGTLTKATALKNGNDDWEPQLLSLIGTKAMAGQVRVFVAGLREDEYETIFPLLYGRSGEIFPEVEGKAINLIATYMFRHPACSFKDINICDMINKLIELRATINTAG